MPECQCWVHLPDFFAQPSEIKSDGGSPWWAFPFDTAECPRCGTVWTAYADIEAGFSVR